MERNKKHTALWNVARRECRRLVSRPLYLFCMVIAPLFCYIFFTTLMDSGLPTDMPVGVVDQDMSATSRQLIRNLDAFEQTAVVAPLPYHQRSPYRHAARRDLRFLLHSRRYLCQSAGRTAAQTLFLYKQYPAHRRFTPLQGHEDDERIGIRCRST